VDFAALICCFVFLIVEEESISLTHHLPAGLSTHCFFVPASGLGCLLVVDVVQSGCGWQRQNSAFKRGRAPAIKGVGNLNVESLSDCSTRQLDS
jgi:hypothetical protein